MPSSLADKFNSSLIYILGTRSTSDGHAMPGILMQY